VSKPRRTTYLVTCADKISLGKAYYKTIKESSTDLTKTSVEVLLYLYEVIPSQVIPFKPHFYLKRGFYSYTSYAAAVRELTKKGYMERKTLQTFLLSNKGKAFVSAFWVLHGKHYAKLTK